MRKLFVVLALLIAVYFTARPYVHITLDDVSGVSVRSSVQHKFETLWSW